MLKTYNQPWIYDHVTVDRVVDGDTVDVIIDLGFSVQISHRLRLAYIDTPERGKKGFNEATKALKDMLASARSLRVETIKNEKDSFGRYIAVLSDAVDGRNFNQMLLDLGYAEKYQE